MGSAVAGTGASRTWPQRLLFAFNAVMLAGSLVGATVLGYLYYRFDQLPRVSFATGVLGGSDPGDPQNFLLVGSDSRAFADDDEEAARSFGDTGMVAGQRADTIILVQIDPRARTAAMVSFPRDLWGPIAGSSEKGRINAAFEGGPEQLIRTITQRFDVPVDHYVQVDFSGFKGIVDAVGGVEIYLSAPVRDRDANGRNVSGLDIDRVGCVELDGDQALAYVRSRHFEQFVDGRWKPDPTGDLGRISRQQDFIRRAVREALAKGFTSPARLERLIGVAQDNVAIDESIDPGDLLDVGRRFRSLDPGDLQQFNLPVEPGRVGGASVLLLKEDEAEEVLDAFRPGDTTEAELRPTRVQVRVLNGSGRAGEAGETAAALSASGFGVAGVGDGRFGTASTTVRYAPGQRQEAELVRRYLADGAELEEDPEVRGVDAVLVTGRDFAGVLGEPRAPDPPPLQATTVAPPSGTGEAEAPPPSC
ncbi:MAG: LCP family protein [Acidimicrobiales bacterium]